ncbi:MAG: sulfatase [Planctomycetota bacterium]|nr:sulfatase [Planctomycetota bacterium]
MFRSFLILLALVALPTTSTSFTLAAERPNFVFFLVDDLGWADIGCNGSTFYETPNIDALAASGMRFTQGYAACPVCSPTRASILTWRHPVRVDITDWIPGRRLTADAKVRFEHIEDRDHLELQEITIAEALREQADYQTFFLGKWHLGGKGHWPTDQGFDVNIGGCDKGSPPGGYYAPWKNPNLAARQQGEYLTKRLTDEATGLIQQADRDRPFLLYFSYYNVHTPIQADRRTVNHFQAKAANLFSSPTPAITERDAASRARQDNPDYASMVRAVDLSVGEVLKSIEQAGLSENTVVIFFSDNGGLCTLPARRQSSGGPTSNLPLRSGKGWLYEGGIREPMIIRAPGVTQAGAVCDQPVVSTDFFPTILALAGLPTNPKLHADGVSLIPQLRGETADPRSLFWHYPHYHGSNWKPGAAIRRDRWKLIEFYETSKVELYDLANDPGESNDLSLTRPALRDELRKELKQWQQSLKAKMPLER